VAPLGQMPEAKGPGDILSIDITGPYNTSKEGYRYLLTCIDHFTKWPEAIPLRDQEAPTIARISINNIFSRHGVYNTVLSDRGRNFTSELMKETCSLLGARKVFTSPYHPEGNGQIENFHRVLNNGQACEIDGRGDDWVKYVDLVLWAYRSQPQCDGILTILHVIWERVCRTRR
jgi:transposase InsO family protein